MSADVKYVVEIDAQGAIKKIQQLDQAFDGLQKQAPKTASVFQSTWAQMAAGFTVANLVQRGLGTIRAELVASIREAADYEKALKGLDAAFAISGRTMPGMAANLKRYASELEKLGLAEDDAILRAESLLLQITNLDEEGVKRATRGAIGMASVFGMDLQSAVESVAKAEEGNFMALQRLLPAVRNATTEEGKRAAAMKAFEDLYSRAIADTETYAGQVDKLGREWKSARQELGDAVLQTGFLQDTMAGFTAILNSVSGATKREYNESLRQSIEANNQANKSLEEMAERLGWNKRDLALLRVQYDLSSVELVDWVQNNQFGTKAAAALNVVLKEEAADLARARQGFTETGEAVKKATDPFIAMTLEILKLRGQWKMPLPMSEKVIETPLIKTGKENPYERWMRQQRDFAEEMTGTWKDELDKQKDYSDEFYNNLVMGFTNAFLAFRLTTAGFKDFFISTWETIKQAFFQILADILARWITMAFVKTLMNVVTAGSGFFPAEAGSIGMQKGFHGVISRPTIALIGEAGPEQVDVSPLPGSAGYGSRAGRGGDINIHIHVDAIDAAGVERFLRQQARPILLEMIDHGDL
jgi:hypothetical protein